MAPVLVEVCARGARSGAVPAGARLRGERRLGGDADRQPAEHADRPGARPVVRRATCRRRRAGARRARASSGSIVPWRVAGAWTGDARGRRGRAAAVRPLADGERRARDRWRWWCSPSCCTPWPREVVALAGAGVLLLSRRMASRELLGLVDWHLLVLFVGLFVVNAAVARSGLLRARCSAARRAGVDLADGRRPVRRHRRAVQRRVERAGGDAAAAGRRATRSAGPILALASTLAGNLLLVGSIANIIVVDQAAAARRAHRLADARARRRSGHPGDAGARRGSGCGCWPEDRAARVYIRCRQDYDVRMTSASTAAALAACLIRRGRDAGRPDARRSRRAEAPGPRRPDAGPAATGDRPGHAAAAAARGNAAAAATGVLVATVTDSSGAPLKASPCRCPARSIARARPIPNGSVRLLGIRQGTVSRALLRRRLLHVREGIRLARRHADPAARGVADPGAAAATAAAAARPRDAGRARRATAPPPGEAEVPVGARLHREELHQRQGAAEGIADRLQRPARRRRSGRFANRGPIASTRMPS